MKNKFCALSLILFSGIPAQVFAESFTAKQLVEVAVKNSTLTKAFELEAESKQKLSEQAAVWDNPSVEIGSEKKTEPGGDTNFVRYGLSQTIYLPGRFSAKRRVFEAEAQIAQLNLASNDIKLRAQVMNLVFEFKAAKEKQSHAEERLDRFKTVEGYIKSRVFASPQKKAEAAIVTAKLMVLQKEFFHLKASADTLWNELNSYLKMSSQPDLQLSWFRKAPDFSERDLSEQIMIQNPELKIQTARVSQSQNESDLLSAESWPGLTVSGTYLDGSGYNPEKVYGLGVSIPIPIFNSNRAARSAGQLKSKAETERFNYQVEQSQKELKSALMNFELAKRSVVGLPVKKIEELEKAIQETDRGFRRGQVDLLTYLEADSQHFESLSSILDSQLDLVKSMSDLQVLTGNSQLFGDI